MVRTVLVSNVLIEIELSVDVVAVAVAEGGTEDVTVVNANVLGRLSERHVGRIEG